MLKKSYKELYQRMTTNTEKVLIHCAAGIHRTGITIYSLLRLDGVKGIKPGEKGVSYEKKKDADPDNFEYGGEALQLIAKIRMHTAKGVA